MNRNPSPAPQLPPDVARYLEGPPPEAEQFDFLIGDWSVAASRFQEDGSPLLQYRAVWTAQHLNEKRMVVDDFSALLPDGRKCSSYVTLRSFCPTTRRWEMTGLAALQPTSPGEWYGTREGDEMHIIASGKDPVGRSIRNRIRFFAIQTESFAWESTLSTDDGQTWHKAASLLATRAVS